MIDSEFQQKIREYVAQIKYPVQAYMLGADVLGRHFVDDFGLPEGVTTRAVGQFMLSILPLPVEFDQHDLLNTT